MDIKKNPLAGARERYAGLFELSRYIVGEKQILSSVDYPFIIKLHEVFKDNTYLYIALGLGTTCVG